MLFEHPSNSSLSWFTALDFEPFCLWSLCCFLSVTRGEKKSADCGDVSQTCTGKALCPTARNGPKMPDARPLIGSILCNGVSGILQEGKNLQSTAPGWGGQLRSWVTAVYVLLSVVVLLVLAASLFENSNTPGDNICIRTTQDPPAQQRTEPSARGEGLVSRGSVSAFSSLSPEEEEVDASRYAVCERCARSSVVGRIKTTPTFPKEGRKLC